MKQYELTCETSPELALHREYATGLNALLEKLASYPVGAVRRLFGAGRADNWYVTATTITAGKPDTMHNRANGNERKTTTHKLWLRLDGLGKMEAMKA